MTLGSTLSITEYTECMFPQNELLSCRICFWGFRSLRRFWDRDVVMKLQRTVSRWGEPWADWKDCTIPWRHGKSWESLSALSIPDCLWLFHEALKIFPESSTTRLVQAEVAIGTGTIPGRSLDAERLWTTSKLGVRTRRISLDGEHIRTETLATAWEDRISMWYSWKRIFAKWMQTDKWLSTQIMIIMNFNLNVLYVLYAISSFYQQTGVGLSAFQVNLRLGYPADSVEDGTCAASISTVEQRL